MTETRFARFDTRNATAMRPDYKYILCIHMRKRYCSVVQSLRLPKRGESIQYQNASSRQLLHHRTGMGLLYSFPGIYLFIFFVSYFFSPVFRNRDSGIPRVKKKKPSFTRTPARYKLHREKNCLRTRRRLHGAVCRRRTEDNH